MTAADAAVRADVVTAAQAVGAEVIQTGGWLRALELERKDGRGVILVTDELMTLEGDPAERRWTVAAHNEEGEMLLDVVMQECTLLEALRVAQWWAETM